MSLIRFSVARNRRYFALSIRKFEQKGESSQSARDETFETPESDAHPESKYGKGERKFKVDWSDKQQRWAHAAINSNPVIKPYHQKKEPFAAWEINEKEDKELRLVRIFKFKPKKCQRTSVIDYPRNFFSLTEGVLILVKKRSVQVATLLLLRKVTKLVSRKKFDNSKKMKN